MLLKPSSPCGTCIGNKWGRAFVPASGSGENGVLVIAEAAGEHEAKEGMPLVGKAGYYLWQNLARAGIERDGFMCHNALSCRPPDNKLAKMPYEAEVIAHCSPLLDATIEAMHKQCRLFGKHMVIVTLGRIAFKRIMRLDDKHPIMRHDYLCYPFWNEEYQCWVVAADHPSYLMRGNNHLIPVLQFAFKRALEIAEKGVEYAQPRYLLDPAPSTFQTWIKGYKDEFACHPYTTFLSYDIETPYKRGKDEDKMAREDDDDWTILRCSFVYRGNEGVSVPWRAEYIPLIEDLFATPGAKVGWNNSNYDSERVMAQMPIHGDELDGMLMWHVLNSALPKSLGFVTPFYAQDVPVWKYMSAEAPAFYNAKDADMAWRNVKGIEQDLRNTELWPVFERHVVQLNRVLQYMSQKGVNRDEVQRKSAEIKLTALLDEVEAQMVEAVPADARKHQVYKKAPKDVSGMVQVPGIAKVTTCPRCGALKVKVDHFKSIGKKRLGKGEEENPCVGLKSIKLDIQTTLWAKPLDFKVSVKSLTSYQKSLRHSAIINRRENRVTFDEDAIKQLIKKYPNDPLYPAILKHREYQKLLSTYVGVTNPTTGRVIGGMQTGRDLRIHPMFTHNPSTLRMACQNPNMQNLPRAGRNPDGTPSLQTLVRDLIVAGMGNIFVELDFSAIEAVLVGYFASMPDYIRLSKMGIHSYLASHVLGRPADLSWSDADLRAYFKEIKKSNDSKTQQVYNGCKRAIHLSGYGGTPRKMNQAEPETFPTVKYAEWLQGVYFDLFPNVKKWQLGCQMQAEKDGFLRNPFGYVHRFYRVFSYKKECGKWVRGQGDDANKVLAFLPQSTAAGIIKEAMLRLFQDRFEEAGQYLRLQVHDSLVAEPPKNLHEAVMSVMREEMERPVPELRLPASYGMGENLVIETEGKVGERWGSMR